MNSEDEAIEIAGLDVQPAAETEQARPQTVREAIAALRAEPEPGVTAEAEDEAGSAEASAEPDVPRDEQGRFIPRADLQSETEPAEPVQGEDADTADESQPEDAPGDDAPFVLALPARRNGENDVEVEIAGIDAPTRERLAQMRNGYMRGEEVRARTAELETIRNELQADPAAFLVSHVHPSIRQDTALALLASLMDDEDAYNTVVDTLNAWDEDPAERAAYRQQQEEAAARRPTAAEAANVREIGNVVLGFIPEGADPANAQRFARAALGALQAYVEANEMTELDPADVPDLIGAIAKRHGYTAPAQPSDRAEVALPAAPIAPAPAKQPTAQEIEVAQTQGQKFAAANARRRLATAVSPAGLGAVTGSGTLPPAGQTSKERLAWFKSQR